MSRTQENKLKKRAEEACRNRNHLMTRWEVHDRSVIAECKLCRAWAQVIFKPYPNEIDISGSAVAENCKGA